MADLPIDIVGGDTLAFARRKMQSVIAAGFHELEIVADPVFDTRLLLMHALSISQIDLISNPNGCLTDDEARKVAKVAAGRAEGIPVARLIGEAEFWSLPFYLSSETLIPRPDSESVVEAALEHLGQGPLSILDVGTGTGCIALAVLSERENATGIGVDINAGALEIANKNAARLGLEKQFSTVQSNLFGEISKTSSFDIIVSNPPYIASNIIESLGVEVRDHDPRVALDGGSDGLDIYRRLITQAGNFLASGGALILEIGYDQGIMVAELLEQAGFESELLFDLGNQPRVLVGHKIAINP